VNERFSTPPNNDSPLSDTRAAGDPVSWLQIQQGWTVVTADGAIAGSVAQTEGDKNDDIFDGLAIVSSGGPVRYVPAETIGAIFPGRVTLKIGSADLGTLKPFRAPPPETKWTAGKRPLSARVSNWLRGKR